MPNELVINATLGETRIARLENSVVTELAIERAREGGVVGNIYKGKVVRVLPGMQAAFIDVGLDRTVFMHASDVVRDLSTFEDDQPVEADDEAVVEDAGQKPRGRRSRTQREAIEDVLKEGREILVQVEKEPMGTKGARVTSHVSLPGRYLVYLPTVKHVGVSRRIGDVAERMRLKKLLAELHKGPGGFIVRTVSAGMSEHELEADIDYLTELWRRIEDKAVEAKAPSLVLPELDVLSRVVRDWFSPDIDRFVLDSREAYEQVRRFVGSFMPDALDRVQLHEGSEPIFDAFGIEIEITRALGQKVWLKSGGYIIVEQTEALTAIDVNTGRFVGRRNVEDTILKTNLEAVKEIVYQLRLRNLGGIIILDFIDMERHANRTKVYNALKEALKNDRARTTITKISELGLVEMTRKRTREDLRRQLTEPCLYCEGKGYLKSATTVAYEIFREIQREASDISEKQIVVTCHQAIANVLYDEERKGLEELEKSIKKRILVKSIGEYHPEQFDVSGK